jgi:PAS domain-containing protein
MLEEFASELGLNRLKVLYQPESQVFKGITLPGDISKTVIKLNSKPHTLYIRPKTKPPYVDNSMFKRVEKILNSIGEGITICDANLRHVFSNARFGEMTGLDKDAQGVSILEHYP